MPTEAVVKERPILMSAPMIRAILQGRKTQTRRIATKAMKTGLRYAQVAEWWTGFMGWQPIDLAAPPLKSLACPYGMPGDRLWVRETWMKVYEYEPGTYWALPVTSARTRQACKRAKYRATDTPPANFAASWKPSIHMPRWASRITLEVTDVRVERVQEISGFDARDEGFPIGEDVPDCDVMHFGGGKKCKAAFRELWEKLNGPRGYGWDVNPWVWVVSFKRLDEDLPVKEA